MKKMFFAIVIFSVLLATCFSNYAGGDATITIQLAPNSGRAAWPPDAATVKLLAHTVKFICPAETLTFYAPPGQTYIEIHVLPRDWDIEVLAELDGIPYAKGTARADKLKTGINVTINH